MPVFIIVVWEIPIWLLVLAGLCVLGVSAYEYIPIICAIVTFFDCSCIYQCICFFCFRKKECNTVDWI